jgi:hypothetical protein
MSGIAASAFLGLAVVVGTPNEAPSEPTFEIDVSNTTRSLRAGETGTFAVHIKPAEGYKVNEKGPLRLQLEAPAQLALEKAVLSRDDARGEATAPELACGLDARKEGEAPIDVRAMFVICDEAGTVCEMKRETFEVAVEVD